MVIFSPKEFKDTDEFFPYYLSQHRNNFNRLIHVIGNILANMLLIYCLLNKTILYLPLVPILFYGFAWFGHLVFEKNKPATWGYAKLSLYCDYRMVWEILSGNIINLFREYEIENIRYIDTDLF